MSTLGKAVIEFSADTAKFTGDVGRAAAQFSGAMNRMQAGLLLLRNAAVSVAAVGGIGAMVKSAIDAGDQLSKLTQKTGISVERLSELKLAAELGGVDLDTFAKGVREFNRSLVEAQDANSKAGQTFKALGVDIKAGPDAAFRQFAEAMSKLEDGQVKTTAAMEILKKSGADMIPVLNGGKEGLDKAAASARNLGLVFSADFAKQAEQFNDNLTLLGKTVSALGISLAKELVPGMTTITTAIVKAKEEGNLFVETLRQIGLLGAAIGGKIWFGALDEAATRKFREAQGSQTASGRIRGADGKPLAGQADPNAEMLACALSGGKWINGKCVRAGGAAKKDSAAADYAASLTAQQDVLDEASRMGVEFLQKQQQQIDDHNQRLQKASEEGWIAHADAVFAAAEEELVSLARIAEEAEKTDNVMRDLGLTFSSAFEEAVIGGKKFSEVLKGLSQDIARIIMRKTITEPLGNAVGDWVKGMDFGKILGFKAEGGPVTGGMPYIVGEQGPEVFVPGSSGAIVPNGAMAGGQVFNVDLRGASVEAVARLERFVSSLHGSIESRAIGAMRGARMRGMG